MATQTVKLNNGMEMPIIGLGTCWGKDIKTVVRLAIRIGYRLFDTAFYYNNEKDIGNAVREKIEEGVVKREDLFIVEKLWNTQHHPDKVLPALKKCLERLRMDYVDTFLMHWPFCYQNENEYAEFGKEDYTPFTDTWRAMEECVRQGYAKSIGVCNFNERQLKTLLKIAKYKPVINQIECHPYLSQKDLIEFCREHKIVVMAFSPLYAPYRNYYDVNVFHDATINDLAQKYDKQHTQITLRYLIQRGIVPIPKSDKALHLRQNFNVFDFELDLDDMQQMEKLNQNKRCIKYIVAKTFKEYPFEK